MSISPFSFRGLVVKPIIRMKLIYHGVFIQTSHDSTELEQMPQAARNFHYVKWNMVQTVVVVVVVQYLKHFEYILYRATTRD